MRRTFLGFRRFTCSRCGDENTLPLSVNYRSTYILIVFLVLVMSLSSWAEGRGFLPGLLWVAMVVALVKDAKYQRLAAESRPAVPTQDGIPHGAPAADEALHRECPHCAETILRRARLCKHCRSEVEPLTARGARVHEQCRRVTLAAAAWY